MYSPWGHKESGMTKLLNNLTHIQKNITDEELKTLRISVNPFQNEFFSLSEVTMIIILVFFIHGHTLSFVSIYVKICARI